MKQIESDLVLACGSIEKKQRILGPILNTMKPILTMLGVSAKEISQEEVQKFTELKVQLGLEGNLDTISEYDEKGLTKRNFESKEKE